VSEELIPTIAIPARNEADRLPALLDALSAQSWIGASGRRLHVTIVLNNCTDGSQESLAGAAERHPALALHAVEINLPPAEAHVGAARRLAAAEALAQVHSTPILMTTDADARPEPTWVEANLRAIHAGAHLVGGLVVGDPDEEARHGPEFLRRAKLQLQYDRLSDELAALIDPLPYDPWPRHRDHTGASLAVRADVYHAVGGFPALPFREDLAFVSNVRAAGFHLRHQLDAKVKVSARLDGRAPGGMSDCLKRWISAAAENRAHLVEDPYAIATRLTRRHLLRALGSADRNGFGRITRHLALDSAVVRFIAASRGIAAVVETFAPDRPDATASVPVEAAIAQIEWMIEDVDTVQVA
jgi:GT2 family glycosyltransferase